MKNINCNPYEKIILNYVLTNLILISHSKKKKFNFFVKYKITYIMHITDIYTLCIIISHSLPLC